MVDENTNVESFTLHVMELAPAEGAAPLPALSQPSGELQLHSGNLFGIFRRDKEVPADKLLNSWENTRRAIYHMLEDTKQDEDKGIQLDELEVSLSVSGEGNIVFVTAKAEASVVLKFKRKA